MSASPTDPTDVAYIAAVLEAVDEALVKAWNLDRDVRYRAMADAVLRALEIRALLKPEDN